MAASNEFSIQWKGSAGPGRGCGTLLAAKKLYKGALAMAVNGVAQPLLSGTSLIAKCATVAGADDNGGVILRALRRGVRIVFAGGTSKTLGVSVSVGANSDVTVQLGTDNANAVTSTGAEVVNAIRGHAMAAGLLVAQATGTGAGLAAAVAATAVPFIMVLGWASKSYGDAGSGSDQSIEMLFYTGTAMAGPKSSDAPARAAIGGPCWLEDDVTCRATPVAIDLTATLADVDSSGYPYIEVR